MARTKRTYSKLNTYTIILRGKEEIFDSVSVAEMLKIFNKYRAVDGCKLYAYAFNYKDAYFVVREGQSLVGTLIKKITVSFVKYIKSLNRDIKSVFHGRYLSEALDTNEDILNAILSVNELKNKKTISLKTFISSKDKYFKNPNIDSDFVLENTNKRKFKYLHNNIELNSNLSPIKLEKFNDEQVAKYIYDRYGVKASEIHRLKTSKMEKILLDVVKVTKASARQIGRISKLSLRYLWQLFKKKEDNNA